MTDIEKGTIVNIIDDELFKFQKRIWDYDYDDSSDSDVEDYGEPELELDNGDVAERYWNLMYRSGEDSLDYLVACIKKRIVDEL